MDIVDKRRPPQITTTTLPPNPTPHAPASWAGGAPQGARPPTGAAAPPKAATPAAAPLRLVQPTPAPAPTPQTAPGPKPWELASPPPVDPTDPASLERAIHWALGAGGGPENAFEWFGKTPQWEGAILRYIQLGGPIQGWDAKWLGDVTPENAGTARAPIAGQPAIAPTTTAGAVQATVVSTVPSTSDPGRRWTKGLREQAKKLFAAGATDEDVSNAIAFPLDKVKAYREGLKDQPVGGVEQKSGTPTATFDAAGKVTAVQFEGNAQPPTFVWHRSTGAKMQLLSLGQDAGGNKRAYVKLEDGTETSYDLTSVVTDPKLVQQRPPPGIAYGTGPETLAAKLRVDHGALVGFLYLARDIRKPHEADPTPEELDALAWKLVEGAEAWLRSRGHDMRREERDNRIPGAPPGEEIREFTVKTEHVMSPSFAAAMHEQEEPAEAPASGASFPDEDDDTTGDELGAAHE